MKAFIVIFIVAALSSVIIIGCAGPSSATLGDKGVDDIIMAQKAITAQTDYYRDQIASLKEENNQLGYNLMDYQAIQDSAGIVASSKRYFKQKSYNDSLVTDYREKISRLESLTEEVLIRGLGKDRVNSVVLNGYSAREVADAYATVKYVNDAGMSCVANASQRNAAVKKDSCGLRAILENTRYQQVIAKITGPVGFYREFKINPHGFSPVFALPMPGSYTTTFINCNNESDYAVVTKQVGQNIFYYVDDAVYDYKATAILR